MEYMSDAVYLMHIWGTWELSLVKTGGELESRIETAMSTIEIMKEKVVGNRGLSCKDKMEVCNAMVVPTLMYGCEFRVI